MFHPVGSRRPGHQTLFNSPMETFDDTIRLGVIGRRPDPVDPKQGIELLPEVGLELPSLVRDNLGWDAESSNPMPEQGASTVLGSHGDQGNGFSPSGVAINNGEKVSMSL